MHERFGEDGFCKLRPRALKIQTAKRNGGVYFINCKIAPPAFLKHLRLGRSLKDA